MNAASIYAVKHAGMPDQRANCSEHTAKRKKTVAPPISLSIDEPHETWGFSPFVVHTSKPLPLVIYALLTQVSWDLSRYTPNLLRDGKSHGVIQVIEDSEVAEVANSRLHTTSY